MAKLDAEDLNALKDLIEVTVEDVIERKELVSRTDLSHLPTKDEFYEQTGEILKRLDNLEQEKDVLSDRVSKHEDRIEKIESRLGISAD